MRQKALRIVDYLAHILDSIEQINSYVKNINEVEFINNRLIHDAVIKNIENIGEAGNNLLKRFPDFSTLVGGDTTTFVRAYEMRNFVAHGYFHIDYGLVWNTIQSDLPTFYQQV